MCAELPGVTSERQAERLKANSNVLGDMSDIVMQEGRGQTFKAEGTVCSKMYKLGREPQRAHFV